MLLRNPVILLIVIILVGASLGSFAVIQIAGDPARTYDQSQDAEGTSTNQQLANGGTGAKNRRPPTDRSICRHAKTEKEYELCQAWRAAEGAQNAASVALWQLIISIG